MFLATFKVVFRLGLVLREECFIDCQGCELAVVNPVSTWQGNDIILYGTSLFVYLSRNIWSL